MSGVNLFHRNFGGSGRPPLVILHGLLGSSRNWQTVGRELAGHFEVFALDLRNHGASPWTPGMGYRDLASDVLAWLDANGLETVHLLGHSMGGKTAMRFARDFPQRLRSLTVVDIAPRDYDMHHRIEFVAMNSFDPATLADRRAAEAALESGGVSDWAMRQFLLTNLSRRDTGGFSWDINLAGLTTAIPEVCLNPLAPEETYGGRTLFVIGGKSPFIRPEDRPAIHRYFPQAKLVDLPSSGHNPHIEDRAAFSEALLAHLAD